MAALHIFTAVLSATIFLKYFAHFSCSVCFAFLLYKTRSPLNYFAAQALRTGVVL